MTNNTISNSKEKVQKLLDTILKSLNEDKAEDIAVINMEDKADFAYYMIIATGRSSRHVISTADKLINYLGKNGYMDVGIEGISKGDWVLVDARDIVVHIFRNEIREIYDIEKIWGFTIDHRLQ